MIPKRSSLVAIFLVAVLIGMTVKTVLLWRDGPWDLPNPPKTSAPTAAPEPDTGLALRRLVSTDVIISRNLFDPERGASQTKEAEVNTRAMQRIRSLILLGTAILGPNRYAMLQESSSPVAARPAQGQPTSTGTMRLKMGDMFEGFSLSQIQDKIVVFTRGASRVELALDYFRKVEVASPPSGPAAPAGPARPGATGIQPNPAVPLPRVIPQLPRRSVPPPPPAE